MSLCCILFSGLFINCIKLYGTFDVTYEVLTHQNLTFDKYEMNGEDTYGIYFKEYDTPFEISSITQKEFNKKELAKLEAGTIVEAYYTNSDSKKFNYEICEMKKDSIIYLTLNDFVKVNQNNQVVGMIMCPIMVAGSIVLIVVFIKISNFYNDDKNKQRRRNDNLGNLKIEYNINNNKIQLYNAIDICSLIINNQIVDQYYGVVASKFVLKGIVDDNGKKVLVEAKMGYLNMRLYYDGKLVKKIFMGLG